MFVSKTIKAELYGLTRIKLNKLQDLQAEWEKGLRLEKDYKRLRSQTRLPSYYCRALGWKRNNGSRVISIGKDAFKLVDTGNSFAKFFVSIPSLKGRIWCPLRMWNRHGALLGKAEVSDSKLVCKADRFFLHITIKREMKLMHPSGVVLAVDLGERFLAASVALSGDNISSARLHGKEARGIRRHHAWLRKRLGERKLLRVIKRMGAREKRRIDDLCHRVSKEIVSEAEEMNAAIVLGDLKGIRNRTKGKRFNRIVSSMPYHKLTRFLQYKALWAGIPVVLAGENYSSTTCHRCGSGGHRVSQGLFRCLSCGLEYNADLNGAINLGKRFLDHGLRDGAVGLSALEGDPNSQALYV